MKNIINFPKSINHTYIEVDGNIEGVSFQKNRRDHIDIYEDAIVYMGNILRLSKKEISELMVMWLALYNPDVLRFDDE